MTGSPLDGAALERQVSDRRGRMGMQPVQSQTVTWFLRNIAPDFMWCSAFDLFLMYEQVDEEIDFFVFKNMLSNFKKQGLFLTKKSDPPNFKKGRLPDLYLRNI